MSPDPSPPAFRVDWPAEPTRDLANALLAYFPSRQGARVTRAERTITELLGDDPERNGQPVSEGLYRITVLPLRVQYEILPLNRVVRVISVGFFRVRAPSLTRAPRAAGIDVRSPAPSQSRLA